MKQIVLLSDTHSYMGDEIKRHVENADEIWHAGDIGSMEVAETLQKYAPLRAVYGNIDNAEIRMEFPLIQNFMCEEVKIWMTHIGGYPPRYTPELKKTLLIEKPKLFICGHSHILKVIPDAKLNVLHMNPGAIGKHGFHQVRTLLKFKIEGANISDLNVVEFPR